MKQFLGIIFLLVVLSGVAHAQQDADSRYVAIYTIIQQADNLADGGQPKDALVAYTEAQTKLVRFQKLFPNWDPGIVSYRLDDLNTKITRLTAQTAPKPAAPVAVTATTDATSAKLQTQLSDVEVQLQNVQAENQTLQAKLKEALATQPAAVDANELAAAQQQLRELTKQNELLKAGQAGRTETKVVTVEDTNKVSQLQLQLAASMKKLSDEQKRAQTLMDENASLQKNIAHGSTPSAAVDVLQSENGRLRAQLAALQAANENAAAADELAGRLKDARTQITQLQAAATLASLEKAALENKVRKLSTELAETAANFEARINDLSEQRADLLKKLNQAGGKNSKTQIADASAQMTALNQEVETLRARIAVDESKPVPYTADELSLFKETATGIEPMKRSIKELPAGTAELVASAQKHFSDHDFGEAEADYRQILAHDQNNGLALANLATIELQEGKLDMAEQHIKAAIVQSPGDAYNLSTLGYLKFRQEKYDEALDALSKAAKADPNNPEIQNYLGVTLSHKGLRIQAETALRRAISLDASYAPAHNNIAVIYLSQTPPLPQLARWHYQKAREAGQPPNLELEKMLAEKGAPVSTETPAAQ
ncbi:MAG TPA: tetratricopeptide repeat protein [Candidatus Acidoferrales bacterium]|jgi:Tfp pilus assembly protein PilF|nr:tetratricopeptide repeat protein [Candidatus Acidoferrales bacterium]